MIGGRVRGGGGAGVGGGSKGGHCASSFVQDSLCTVYFMCILPSACPVESMWLQEQRYHVTCLFLPPSIFILTGKMCYEPRKTHTTTHPAPHPLPPLPLPLLLPKEKLSCLQDRSVTGGFPPVDLWWMAFWKSGCILTLETWVVSSFNVAHSRF